MREIATSAKKDEFKQERMFRRVAKMPISKTAYELAEMDSVDSAGKSTFRLLQVYFFALCDNCVYR